MGAKFPGGSYEDSLKDGVLLCNFINKLKPGSIKKINEGGAQFKLMENINNFQKAIKDYGVPDIDVFQTVDLWEKKDIGGVTNTIFAIGRAVSFKFFFFDKNKYLINFLIKAWKDPNFKGPWLGPKPSDECKRDFSEETLRAGEGMVGLQAGSNKGATQAGQNMGAGRKILMNK